jgi:transcriptional regulator GlxA family with amidase domain
LRAFRLAIAGGGPVVSLEEPDQLAAAGLCRAVCREAHNAFALSAMAYDLSMRLVSRVARPSGERHEGVRRAVATIRADPAARHSVESLAKVAGLSRYHFSRLFRQSEGIAPAAYVLRRRLSTAAKLLQETDHPIKAIAIECGLNDAGYLGRRFREQFGTTPAAFRRRMR